MAVANAWLGDRFDCTRLFVGAFGALVAGALVMVAWLSQAAFLVMGTYMVSVACGIGNGYLPPNNLRSGGRA